MEKRLKEYFGKYGEVLQTVIMRDKVTGRPRGFGFVVFANPSLLDRVLQDKHSIDGRTVFCGILPLSLYISIYKEYIKTHRERYAHLSGIIASRNLFLGFGWDSPFQGFEFLLVV
ncbi:heterogeneous nuclear ribonucleoprotein 1-like isoform X1 [Elaeis guineensis]|uniref:Heterogeneous nuclear ribonucleoprotein 1-like n=1 Tax=Elaeis guineensis var. tenera TaxID=51953 RepID=A0A8N4FCH5_ELAGV|nr:heterogeneous nuclear ribonucleoprotein 1-like [Elaeis guineensis]